MNTPEPGIYADIPNETYHAWPGVSKSMLDKIRETPAHLKDYMDDPVHIQTPPLLLGSATHTSVLLPEKFADEYIVMPDIDGRTAEARAFRVAAKKKGKTPLSHIDGRWIKAISARVRDTVFFKRCMNRQPLIENSIVWEMDDYLCRARPDMIADDMVIDLKTTIQSCNNFHNEIFRRRYHWQAYWYLKGCENVGIDCHTFMIIAAHKQRPFLVSLHEITRESEAYAVAAEECEAAFDTYKTCMRSGVWPGYPSEPIPVQVPSSRQQEVLIEESF